MGGSWCKRRAGSCRALSLWRSSKIPPARFHLPTKSFMKEEEFPQSNLAGRLASFDGSPGHAPCRALVMSEVAQSWRKETWVLWEDTHFITCFPSSWAGMQILSRCILLQHGQERADGMSHTHTSRQPRILHPGWDLSLVFCRSKQHVIGPQPDQGPVSP